MPASPTMFSYESMGTRWEVSIWDNIGAERLAALRAEIVRRSDAFDRAYSRFKPDSFVWKIAGATGVVEAEPDFIAMLRLYKRLYGPSGRKLNPLVGYAISDLGYDMDYSLERKDEIRIVPDFEAAVRIIDDGHVELLQPALFDLGALGKGYFVDRIGDYLRSEGIQRFLVNGSGDIYYEGGAGLPEAEKAPIRCGMEHPGDPSQAVGIIELRSGSVCASAVNRRAWKGMHHVIDPHSLSSPSEVAATWTVCDTAAMADALATCLFFVGPDELAPALAGERFECCVIGADGGARTTPGFPGELFGT